jgi:hypothetical protein
MARLILFMASDESGAVANQMIVADGGWA